MTAGQARLVNLLSLLLYQIWVNDLYTIPQRELGKSKRNVKTQNLTHLVIRIEYEQKCRNSFKRIEKFNSLLKMWKTGG